MFSDRAGNQVFRDNFMGGETSQAANGSQKSTSRKQWTNAKKANRKKKRKLDRQAMEEPSNHTMELEVCGAF